MSRIGKQPITLPAKVKVELKGRKVFVEGPKGKLNMDLPRRTNLKVDGATVVLSRDGEDAEAKALHGLSRALVNNMVKGVAEGYERILELMGTGYRVELKGTTLHFALGFSHPVVFPVPKGLTATIPGDSKGTVLVLNGADKELIGQTAAKIRGFRPPEPYKGKGVRYRGERVREKAGKAGKGGKK